MNRFLFSIIGLLLLGVVITGGFALAKPPAITAQPAAKTTTTSSPSTTAPSAGTYTLAEVATHNSQSSCYTAINGSVYDVTPFIQQHPGGAGAILSLCGTDGTAAFEGQHGGQSRPASELASYKIGVLTP